MNICWERLYDRWDHLHRDPVANVVIYSAITLFASAVSLACGVPAWLLDHGVEKGQCNYHVDILQDADYYETAEGIAALVGINQDRNGCNMILAWAIAAFVMVVAALGIVAGELHRPNIYSAFGGIAFVACWLELFGFVSQMHSYGGIALNSTLPEGVDYWRHAERVGDNKPIGMSVACLGLGSAVCATHGLSLICLFLAMYHAWYINSAFTRQEKEIFAERHRARYGMSDLTIAKVEGVDNEAFKSSGLMKSKSAVSERAIKTIEKKPAKGTKPESAIYDNSSKTKKYSGRRMSKINEL